MTLRGLMLVMSGGIVGAAMLAAQPAPVGPGAPPATVDVVEGRKLLEANAGNAAFVVLDVRSAGEFAAGHLPGAVNVSIHEPDFADRIGRLDRTATYLLYCRTQNRSGAAANLMRRLGFERVTVMHGGFADWTRRGFPLASSAPTGTR